ncbi:MAG TPA: hypothetical protein V6D06_13020 [Trichocoleus sp.]
MTTLETIHDLPAEAALSWIDDLFYSEKGYRLNDLERQVFLGSWHGQTYETIYPLNPQYVEKSVGYKLWRKLSELLGEKVSKKRIRGAVMRRLSTSTTAPIAPFVPLSLESWSFSTRGICIVHQRQDWLAQQLAQLLSQLLKAAGHPVLVEAAELQLPVLQTEAQKDWVVLITQLV